MFILGAFDKYRQMHPSFLNDTKSEIPTTLTQYFLLAPSRTLKPPPIYFADISNIPFRRKHDNEKGEMLVRETKSRIKEKGTYFSFNQVEEIHCNTRQVYVNNLHKDGSGRTQS